MITVNIKLKNILKELSYKNILISRKIGKNSNWKIFHIKKSNLTKERLNFEVDEIDEILNRFHGWFIDLLGMWNLLSFILHVK